MKATDAMSLVEAVLAFIEGFEIVIINSEEYPHLICAVKNPAATRVLLDAEPWRLTSNPLKSIANSGDCFCLEIPGPKHLAEVMRRLCNTFPDLIVE